MSEAVPERTEPSMADMEEGAGRARGQGLSVAGARAMVRALEVRAEQALELGREVTATQLEDLITGVSARRLAIEAERLRTRRRAEALREEAKDAEALGQVEDLHRREELLGETVGALVELMYQLRARLEQVQSEGPAGL